MGKRSWEKARRRRKISERIGIGEHRSRRGGHRKSTPIPTGHKREKNPPTSTWLYLQRLTWNPRASPNEEMVRREMEEKEPKAELVKEICFISTAFASCEHLSSNARKRVFVDWYLILKVDEDSALDVIRRRYRQLALQLHPDKNKHPKAELAFKLISEAYYCLSDKARRKCFNGERSSNFCKDCYLNWQSDHHESTNNTKIISSNNYKNNNGGHDDNNNKTKPGRQQSSVERASKNHILRKLKQLQNRFREECNVIESYLKATMTSTGRESPIFDPYDPSRFPKYPYQRQTMEAAKIPPGYCFFQPDGAWGQAPCESPVYQIRSDCWARRKLKPQFSKV